MKILEWHKVSGLKKFKWNSNLFKSLFISLNGRSHIIFTPRFCDEMNLNSRGSKCKVKVLGKSFYSLSFNLQKISNSLTFSQSITQQSNKQSNLSIYYNIPKFRILGCYKPTTLKMNIVLEIRGG